MKIVPKASKQLRFLANQIGYLEDLNEHYRNFANGRDDHVTAVYYEKKVTNRTLVIVPRKDADPGVSSVKPVALQKDHVNICKPYGRDDSAYLAIRRYIQNVVDLAGQPDSRQSRLIGAQYYQERNLEDRRDLLQKLIDAGREHQYDYANSAQNRFARQYAKTGLYTAAREDNDIFLSDIETRFINHVYHPLICQSAPDTEIRKALQEEVIDPLSNKTIGTTRFTSNLVLSGLYFLTEQCHIRWDVPK